MCLQIIYSHIMMQNYSLLNLTRFVEIYLNFQKIKNKNNKRVNKPKDLSISPKHYPLLSPLQLFSNKHLKTICTNAIGTISSCCCKASMLK